jgi:hypothetical protein
MKSILDLSSVADPIASVTEAQRFFNAEARPALMWDLTLTRHLSGGE